MNGRDWAWKKIKQFHWSQTRFETGNFLHTFFESVQKEFNFAVFPKPRLLAKVQKGDFLEINFQTSKSMSYFQKY